MKLNELEGFPELGNTIVIDGIEYVKKRKHLTGIEISQIEQIKIRKELKILGTGLLILGCIMSIMALVYIIGAV